MAEVISVTPPSPEDLGLSAAQISREFAARQQFWNTHRRPEPVLKSEEEVLATNVNLTSLTTVTGINSLDLVRLAYDPDLNTENPLLPIAYLSYLAYTGQSRWLLGHLQNQGLPREICDRLAQYRVQINPHDYQVVGYAMEKTRHELGGLD